MTVKSFLLFTQRITPESFSKLSAKVVPDHQKDQFLDDFLSRALFLALAIVRLTASWDTPYSLASWRKLSVLCLSVSSGQFALRSFRLELAARTAGVYTGKRPISRY